MKELAALTREIHKDFQSEAAEIVNDISTQLDGFEDFEEQEKTIQSLQERVDAGRAKVKLLARRVDFVRGRVEGWEKAEEEWQEKTRKRLKIFWIFVSIIGAIVLLLAVFQYTPANTTVTTPSPTGNTTGLLGVAPGLEMLQNQSSPKNTENVFERLKQEDVRLPEDPRLRVFDEL